MKPVLSALTAIALLSACSGQGGPAASSAAREIDQSGICFVRTDADVRECKPERLIFIAPDRWGSERNPLQWAASFCNTNHQVIYNNSGVLCVFTDARMNKAQDSAASGEASSDVQ
ncbi:hypothetical protein L1281_000974 [Neisseria sp. HSC-16F19]|nr:hypothetical protein [Neisseria sp. HSC-16F19]MCP2040391.1 hypothetical protein [Neisseria sp. HSC-16F19]